MLQRQIFLSVYLIEQYQVPLTKGSPSAILSAQPHRCSLDHKCSESKRFSKRPIDRPILVYSFSTLLKEAHELSVNVKICRKRGHRQSDLGEHVNAHTRWCQTLRCFHFFAGNSGRCFSNKYVGVLLEIVESLLQSLHMCKTHIFNVLVSYRGLANQLTRVNLSDRRVLADFLIKHWLGEAGIVCFVMTVAAITEHVYDNVFSKSLSELVGEL